MKACRGLMRSCFLVKRVILAYSGLTDRFNGGGISSEFQAYIWLMHEIAAGPVSKSALSAGNDERWMAKDSKAAKQGQ